MPARRIRFIRRSGEDVILAPPMYEDRPMDVDIEAVAREISENGFPKENGWKSRKQKVTT
jgi:hypothetical protein